MNTLGFLLRMLRRDARAGELHLLAAALVVAVAALTAVGFFTDRVRQALLLEANQLLGADLLLISDHAWAPGVAEAARRSGLAVAETQTFPSMVAQGGEGRESDAARVQLADIKAVSAGYPLRGRLRVAPATHAADAPADGVPAKGEVWVDERLASALDARVGDRLALGQAGLRVAAILTYEPDRGFNVFSVAPRLLMNRADLDATGLIQPGSRVSYRLLLAGEYKSIKEFRTIIDKLLERGQRIEDAENGRPEIRSALERAQRFLGLSALLSVVLAAVAVALAARRYLHRHLDPCAVMRCLGATQGFLLRVYVGQFALLGVLASAAGCALGFAAHLVLHAWLAQLLATSLPPPGALPAVQGVFVGLLLLFGFSLPPLLQLRRVSTLRVLRRELFTAGMPSPRLAAGYAAGLAALAGLMFWVAGEARLGAYVVAGFTAALLAFAGVAWLAVRLSARLRPAASAGAGRDDGRSDGRGDGRFGWRYGIASLRRHTAASVVQVVALSLGFTALLLLTVTRTELLSAWQRAVPPDAPNRFVINIQPDQRDEVQRFFAADGLQPEFAPMVRGRLARVNGAPVAPERYADERARRLVEREFNLSYRADLPPGNTVTAGRWFAAEEAGRGEASVEEGLAATLGLKVGDRLEFSVAGAPVAMEVVGLRKLDWDSMRVNFFVLTPPGVLDGQPASWITSFHLADDREDFVGRLVRAFPNLTVIDVAAIVRQLQSVTDQAARAVQFVFLFTLAAGIVVLYAALASAAEERRYELAIMRALGARREQLRRAVLAEFAAIGGLAGLIAALAALAIGQVLAQRVFNLELAPAWWLPPAAALGGALLVVGAGWFAAARLLRQSPLDALRLGA
jgi:putative ABC transport system permease protein